MRLFPKTRRGWLIAAGIGCLLAFVWPLTAYPRGMLRAYIDHARGHFEQKTFGYPAPWRWEYARLLEEKYGVKLNAVAGCEVDYSLFEYVEGYNAVSTSLLIDHFGHDIFEECYTLARERWETDHPEDVR